MHVDESVSGGGGSGGGNGSTEAAAAWGRVKRRLRAELGEDVFASWFARLELDCVVGGTARLTVPTRFLKSWIESHYLDRVLNTFKAEVEEIGRIEVGVRGTTAPVRPTRSRRHASLTLS
ncbi:DnaA N-terminal domain-containing protein, partial [Methylobacterium sp. WL6]|uniref:DnaA N-terminal domain-containing protein n=1 Tax=Methylobacterium sp. WL6 TaxID=2603901 RepID=UPI0011D6E491